MRSVAIALLITLLASACARPADERSDTLSSDGEIGSLVRAIDGDSMEVLIGGDVREVRLIGINAPEYDECFGARSRDALITAIQGRDMILTPGVENTDRYGRLLRYVIIDADSVNERMLATGNAVTLQTDHPLAEEYFDIGEAAADQHLGLWAADACGPPPPDGIEFTIVEYDPPGPDGERLNDEYVTIANTSADPTNLTGWILRDESSHNRYRFDGLTVRSGASVTVRTGCGVDTGETVFWCSDRPIWSNDGDSAILQDRNGTVVARRIYRP